MTFLPIVERELRVAARRRAVYWIRFFAALAAAAICTLVGITAAGNAQTTGENMFVSLAILSFVYAPLAGIPATCDSLSEEKREGTLGLLFLTDLKGYDIVLGKLAAGSIHSVYGLLAVLPAMGIPLLMGGVDPAESLRVALTAVNLLFFFLALGIFASAVCRRDHAALGLAAAVAFLVVVGYPFAVLMESSFRSPSADPMGWLAPDPVSACATAFVGGIAGAPPSYIKYFWLTSALTQLYGWLMLGLASYLTPRSWQEKGVGPRRASADAGRRQAARVLLRNWLLQENPYFWRCYRRDSKRLMVWGAVMVCAGCWYWMARRMGADFRDVSAYLLLIFPLNLLLKSWVAMEAARSLSDDRRSGALELLLSTPLTEREIVRGQQKALLRQFGWPIGVALAAQVALASASLAWRYSTSDDAEMMTLCLSVACFVALDAWALSRVGMWLAMSGKTANRAAMLGVGLIIGLPTALFLVSFTIYSAVASGNHPWLVLLWWCLLGLATDAGFEAMTRQSLGPDFREAAARASAPRQAKPKAR